MSSHLQQMRAQFYALAEPVPEYLAYVRRHRLDLRNIAADIGVFGVALCRRFTWDDGSAGFEFSRHGVPCAIIEAICFHSVSGLREEYVADLVAWPLNDPESFATALGPDDGAELLGPASAVQRGGKPLQIYRSPLSWMKAGCIGSVPIKPGVEYWLKKAGGPFIAEDFHHAFELRGLLGRQHQILIPSVESIAA